MSAHGNRLAHDGAAGCTAAHGVGGAIATPR
jgi:hypothetical protein